MHIHFTYELDKEFDNLTRGSGSTYSANPLSKFALEMQSLGIDLDSKDSVTHFIQRKIEKEKIDTEKLINRLQAKWDLIEDEAVKRFEKLYAASDPFEKLTGYLSLNGRCAYNTADHYFFIYIYGMSPLGTVIHELMHFYTHLYIEPIFKKHRASKKFGDFKEALTVLINHVFLDLAEQKDLGYRKHEEIREWIETHWEDGMAIQQLAALYLGK